MRLISERNIGDEFYWGRWGRGWRKMSKKNSMFSSAEEVVQDQLIHIAEIIFAHDILDSSVAALLWNSGWWLLDDDASVIYFQVFWVSGGFCLLFMKLPLVQQLMILECSISWSLKMQNSKCYRNKNSSTSYWGLKQPDCLE